MFLNHMTDSSHHCCPSSKGVCLNIAVSCKEKKMKERLTDKKERVQSKKNKTNKKQAQNKIITLEKRENDILKKSKEGKQYFKDNKFL